MNQWLNKMCFRFLAFAICCSACSFVVSSVDGQTNQGQLSPQQQAELQRAQQAQIQASNSVRGISTQQTFTPKIPEDFNLTPKHEKFLGELLDWWQQSSDQVKRYTCDYKCWEYDPEFCNWRYPGETRLAAFVFKSGSIRFENPDRARYETTKVWGFSGPPTQPGLEPQYKEKDVKASSERWVCDGKSIYEFDFPNKRIMETKIPAEMQGKGLANSPIPFLFGASKAQILERFWIRIVTPENVSEEYWLEAFPKRRQDASTYQKIVLVLARKDFLPKSLTLYAPNYDEVKNPVMRVFEFDNRKINGNWLQSKFDWFIRPSTPFGWKRIELNARNAAVPEYQQNPEFQRK